VWNKIDSASNEVLRLVANTRATPANFDTGYINLQAKSSTQINAEFARLSWAARDVDNASKDGALYFGVMRGNSTVNGLTINGNSPIVYSDFPVSINIGGVSGALESDNNIDLNGSTSGQSPFQIIGNGATALLAGRSATGQYMWPIFKEGTSGTQPLIAGLSIRLPSITDGTANTTNTATLYIEGSQSGITPTSGDYSLWVDAGISRLDGQLDVTTTATSTFAGRLQVGTTTPLSKGGSTFSVKGLMSSVAQFWTSTGTKMLEILNNGSAVGLGIWDFGGATSFEIPNGSPTIDTTGEIGIDTTSDQFLWFGASTKRVLVPFYTTGFNISSTTWGTGTTTAFLAPAMANLTFQGVRCETDAGTLAVSLYDGTNRANYIGTASTTKNYNAYTSNNTFTAGESIRVDVGKAATSPKQIACRFKFTYDAD